LTQNFFLKGEEQEANGYENVVLEEPVSAPDLKFDSFDKIPRRRRPLIALAVFFSFFALGAVAWKTGRAFSKQGSVKLAAQAMVNGQPSASPLPAPPLAPSVPTSGGPPTATVPEPAPATRQAAALTIDQGATPDKPLGDDRTARDEASDESPATVPAAKSPPAESPPAIANAAPKPSTRTTSHRAHRSQALHGYVWSPEAHTLVPASRTTVADPFADPEPSVASPAPARVLEDTPERSVEPASETTAPPAFKAPPPPKPTEGAPIVE
jgi:hypothetical protein